MMSSNKGHLSVCELSEQIQLLLKSRFDSVAVEGEISSIHTSAARHTYITLKEKDTVLPAVIWRGSCSIKDIQEGMSVLCQGTVTTYNRKGMYQLVITSIKPSGIGALLQALEARKKALASEGLFDPSTKPPLPPFPTRIGLITSPQGAVLQDMLKSFQNRFVQEIFLWPTLVQGEEAVESLVTAIKGFNTPPFPMPKPHVLIVARGGGSLEDLLPFSAEAVVRAIASSHIPVISAVGHQTDTSLSDYAATQAAHTPTAAVEYLSPQIPTLKTTLQRLSERAYQGIFSSIQTQHRYLASLKQGILSPLEHLQKLYHKIQKTLETIKEITRIHLNTLKGELYQQHLSLIELHPKNKLKQQKNTFIHLSQSLALPLQNIFKTYHQTLKRLHQLLETLNYQRTIERGFVVVKKNGQIVTQLKALNTEDLISLDFQDGQGKAKVL